MKSVINYLTERTISSKKLIKITKEDLRDKILKGEDISGFDYSDITDMTDMFRNTDITFELLEKADLDTSNVVNVGFMFAECSKLKSIPLLDTSNVTDMYAMFYECSNLESIPLLTTSQVTDMRWMFGYCRELKTIPLLVTSDVLNISKMFYGCSKLESVPDLNTSKVLRMMEMFDGCTSLKEVDFSRFSDYDFSKLPQLKEDYIKYKKESK